jgi:hypothetical protein
MKFYKKTEPIDAVRAYIPEGHAPEFGEYPIWLEQIIGHGGVFKGENGKWNINTDLGTIPMVKMGVVIHTDLDQVFYMDENTFHSKYTQKIDRIYTDFGSLDMTVDAVENVLRDRWMQKWDEVSDTCPNDGTIVLVGMDVDSAEWKRAVAWRWKGEWRLEGTDEKLSWTPTHFAQIIPIKDPDDKEISDFIKTATFPWAHQYGNVFLKCLGGDK